MERKNRIGRDGLKKAVTAASSNKAAVHRQFPAEKKKRKLWIAAGLLVSAVIVFYLMYFPLPIFEAVEESAKYASDAAGLGMTLLTDVTAISREHAGYIELTRKEYEKRREEIAEEIRTGAINDRAVELCREMIDNGDYGPTAQFAGLEWDIPESSAQQDMTLSAEEADEILYLYTCLHDQDWIVPDGVTFEGWLYGVDGWTHEYEVKAFGDTFSLQGHGGYCLNLQQIKRARKLADMAGRKAVAEERARNAGPVVNTAAGKIIFSMLFFLMPSAEAAGDEAYNAAYMAQYDSFCRQYGSAALDTVIYAGVSDQLTGKVTFTYSTEPSTAAWAGCGGGNCWSGTIEEYQHDDAAKAVVAMYNAQPFLGRLVVADTEKTRDIEPYPKAGDYYPTYDGWDYWNNCPAYSGEEVGSYEYVTRHEFSISIYAFDCQELVSFIAKASINGSGIGVLRKALDEFQLADRYLSRCEGLKSLLEECENKGRYIKTTYKTHIYGLDDRIAEYEKPIYIYLPYGYSSDQEYDVVYLISGQGGYPVDYFERSGEQFTNLYDNAIDQGYWKPTILVGIDFYPGYNANGDGIESGGYAAQYCQFTNELEKDIIPYIMENYSNVDSYDYGKMTYDELHEAMVANRDNVGLLGASKGTAIITQGALRSNLDVVSNFGLSNGWYEAGMVNYSLNHPGEVNLAETLSNSRYDINMLFVGSGTYDTVEASGNSNAGYWMAHNTYDAVKNQFPDKFTEGENLFFQSIDGGEHKQGTTDAVLFDFLSAAFRDST